MIRLLVRRIIDGQIVDREEEFENTDYDGKFLIQKSENSILHWIPILQFDGFEIVKKIY